MVPLVASAQAGSGDGFLFGAPRGSFTLRGGITRPSEGSDLFAFVRKELTVGRGDFTGGSLSGELAFFASDRLALQLGVGFSRRTVASVYRDWVDNDDREIEQSTVLRRVPLSAGLRYNLLPSGRSLGRLAWVPARAVPYVSGGVGITWYSFRQAGDFVDYQTLDVFGTSLASSAWAPTAFGAVGVDYALAARLGLVLEARYDGARARMSSDFSGFNSIDLSGVAATAGLTVRF